MDPIRLTREQEAIEIARVESAERSQRAAQFCSRYSADLIADGVSPKEAYAEAVAQWNDLNGVG